MSLSYGFNTGLYGTSGLGLTGYNTSIDYSALNTAANSIYSQLNSYSTSPFAQLSVTNAMPNWYNNIASCFNVNFSGICATGETTTCTPTGGTSTGSTSGTTTTGTTAGGTTGTTTTTGTATGTTEATAEEQAAAAEEASKIQKEADEICEELYVAMAGLGTNNKALDAALAKINKDNIVEVLRTYEEQYGDSLMSRLNGDVQFTTNFCKIANNMKTALAERAEEEGLGSEAKSFRAKVTAKTNGAFGLFVFDRAGIVDEFDSMIAKMN